MVFVFRFKLLRHFRQRSRFQHINHQHRVVSRERASALGDDVWMWQSVLVGRIHELIHAVVHILLDAVVHRAFAARRARAVVVHPQSASAVNEFHVISHLVQLNIELCRFAQGSLYATYFGNLTTNVEVDESERVVESLLVENLQRLEQFRAGESELRGIAPALFPFSRARRSQFDAYAQVGSNVQLFGSLGNDVEFVELLHHNEDALTHLLCQQCQFYVALVFIAIADDERVALALHGDNGMQFRFRSRFESEVEFASVRDDFLHHRLHLVHLDGIDDEVFAFEVILFLRFGEAACRFLDAAVEDVGKAEQHRRGNVAQGEFVHHFAQVYLRIALAGRDIHVSLFVDTKIRGTPTIDVVEFL